MKKIIGILLLICTLTLCLAACGKIDEKKITEELIISNLSDSKGELDGTLTITNGTSDKVLGFNYVLTGINAEALVNKNFAKKIVQKALSNPDSLTYGELKAFKAITEAMMVVSIFYEDENFDSNKYTDDILSIICEGSAKTYENWTISASVNQTSDSITIKAIHN